MIYKFFFAANSRSSTVVDVGSLSRPAEIVLKKTLELDSEDKEVMDSIEKLREKGSRDVLKKLNNSVAN